MIQLSKRERIPVDFTKNNDYDMLIYNETRKRYGNGSSRVIKSLLFNHLFGGGGVVAPPIQTEEPKEEKPKANIFTAPLL